MSRVRNGIFSVRSVHGFVVLAFTSAILSACSSSPAPNTSPGTAPLPFLHVAVPPSGSAQATPYLADAAGREVILRGAAAVGMQDVAYPGANGGPAIFPTAPSAYDGKCPSASPLIPQPPLCEVHASQGEYAQPTSPGSGDDFAQMRQLGFNAVRLVLNWSQLEPTPGRYDLTYLNRISQVVGWASQQGIYVILDMHQDQYSRFILPGDPADLPSGCNPSGGSDGAPAWAVFTDGKPACALLGQSVLNPASSAAFYEFWNNHLIPGPRGQSPGLGLQDHYIGALAALANRFSNNPTVLGYEIMNEPQPGSLNALPLANVYDASSQDLYPFYSRAIEALTGVRDGKPTCPSSRPTGTSCAYPQLAHVNKQQIFYEPMAYRNIVDFSIQVSQPFSQYPNLVYAPHVYTHEFTADASLLGYPPQASPYPPSYDFGYQTAQSDAQKMKSAMLVTEFGANSGSDSYLLAGEVEAQEATLTGSTVWAWKGLSADPASCWCVRWLHSSYQTTSDGTPGSGNPRIHVGADTLIPSRSKELELVYPRFTVGHLLGYQNDTSDGSFWMAAGLSTDYKKTIPGNQAMETEIYIPPTIRGSIRVQGEATLDSVTTEPDGSRLAYIAPRRTAGKCNTAGAGALCSGYVVTVGSVSNSVWSKSLDAILALHPITEPQARAALEQALSQALISNDPSIRAKAAEAEIAASAILGAKDPNNG